MEKKPWIVLDSLGPMKDYRSTDNLAKVWAEVELAMDSLQSEYNIQLTERERFLYALKVLENMLSTLRARANRFPGPDGDPAINENLDIYQLMSDWIDFVKSKTGGVPPPVN